MESLIASYLSYVRFSGKRARAIIGFIIAPIPAASLVAIFSRGYPPPILAVGFRLYSYMVQFIFGIPLYFLIRKRFREAIAFAFGGWTIISGPIIVFFILKVEFSKITSMPILFYVVILLELAIISVLTGLTYCFLFGRI